MGFVSTSVFFFKQKTAYEMRISDWSSDVCSSDLDEIAQLMLKEGVPCAPVRELSEVIEDENMHARGSLQRIDHPELGRIVVPHRPLRFQGSPLIPLDPSPSPGSDAAESLEKRLGSDAPS